MTVLSSRLGANASTGATVTAQDLAGDDATGSNQTWVVDSKSGGTSSLSPSPIDSRGTFEMRQQTNLSSVTVLRSFGPDVRSIDVPALLADSSFSYTGSNVNFQLAMFYTPTDNRTDDPGWLSTQRVGTYEANGRIATLDQLLGQMASYEIYGIGASVGPGTAGDDSWLANLTYGGTSYTFGNPVAAFTDAPAEVAASSDSLDEYTANNNFDPVADTANLTLTGNNADLNSIDPMLPIGPNTRRHVRLLHSCSSAPESLCGCSLPSSAKRDRAAERLNTRCGGRSPVPVEGCAR